ncbi:hypothetical protein BTVI_24622 [Pitangus sulphuratus]|nr:hypothetical protein BTVI_24622 [Pitangus sulphuratus]
MLELLWLEKGSLDPSEQGSKALDLPTTSRTWLAPGRLGNNSESSRPGRPPKRTQSVTSPENSHIMPHSVPGLMSPGIIPPTVTVTSSSGDVLFDMAKPLFSSKDIFHWEEEKHCFGTPSLEILLYNYLLVTTEECDSPSQIFNFPGWKSIVFCTPGLTAAAAAAAAATNAAIAEAMKVKKIKLEAMSNYHANNNQHGADSENGDLNSSVGYFCRLQLIFSMKESGLIA